MLNYSMQLVKRLLISQFCCLCTKNRKLTIKNKEENKIVKKPSNFLIFAKTMKNKSEYSATQKAISTHVLLYPQKNKRDAMGSNIK